MKKIARVFIIIAVTASIGMLGLYFYFQRLTTINKEDAYLIIKKELNIKDVSEMLQNKSIIKSKNMFLLYTKINGITDGIKSSRLIIKPNTTYKELILKLQSGQSDFSIVTIPEGFEFYKIGERLEKNASLKLENFLKLNIDDLTSNNIISKRDNTYYDLEGFLYPDTDYIPSRFTEKAAANLMFNRFKSVFSSKYVSRSKELGLSINEVITIASLIEKEAANDSERSKIAGVIYNRMKKGMPLQIDPSVIYAITKGKNTMSRVTYKDLKVKDPYNTYIYKGLPPGPIASPGKPSIEAALYPESHDYLYYVASEKGHVFSKTYEEHLSNIRKYLK